MKIVLPNGARLLVAAIDPDGRAVTQLDDVSPTAEGLKELLDGLALAKLGERPHHWDSYYHSVEED